MRDGERRRRTCDIALEQRAVDRDGEVDERGAEGKQVNASASRHSTMEVESVPYRLVGVLSASSASSYTPYHMLVRGLYTRAYSSRFTVH